MQAREDCLEQLQELLIQTHLRILRLEKELPHTPGCIVRKGAKKQYTYWQVRQDGRQLQHYVPAAKLPEVEKKMELMKKQQRLLWELRSFLRELKRMLRAAKVVWEEVLSAYRKKRTRRKAEASRRDAAKKAASGKKYASNYRYMSDKGDLVASKSELLIVNTLYAYGVDYGYEEEREVSGVRLKPDVTVRRADGSVVIWEHAGLLDDAEYRRKFEKRLELYAKAGFVQGKNLIVTHEEDGAFSAVTVRRIMETYNLV